MDDFEREIEFELKRLIDPQLATSVPPRRTVQSRTTRTRALVGGAGAAIAMKLVTGVAAAAAAVTVAGAATTGSLDPNVWGQQVSHRVEECKAALAEGQHGIGDCVSAFAKTHGAGVASDARHHGNGNGHGNGSGNGSGNGNGNGNGNGHDKEKDKQTPPGLTKRSPDPEPEDPARTGPPPTIKPGR
jgi:hypothetical protein